MPKKILIIEDEEILADLLKTKLTGLGYDVSVAPDGMKGWEALQELLPDLVLLDIVMPRMSGIELLEHKMDLPSVKTIPVIIISNSGQPVELQKCKELGAKDWLIKTEFDPQEVVTKVVAQIGTAK
jgi:CheY-like chemotaxis protein